METVLCKSAGESPSDSSAGPTSGNVAPDALVLSLALRDGSTTVSALIDAYMTAYVGRDPTRGQRLAWWQAKLGDATLSALDGDADRIHDALDEMRMQRGRYWAGIDADGNAIYKAKGKPYAPATINRFGAALGAVFGWAIKRRIAPKGWANPCKDLERLPEHNERVRFLSEAECKALLHECKRSAWPKLYALALLAVTTAARRGELEGLRWQDVDLDNAVATLHQTKNGDRRVLPLTPAVVDELRKHAGAPGALLFPSRRRPDVPYNHVPAWHKALKDAGIRGFVFHDLRHTAASYLAMSGASLIEIGDVLGHRSSSVTRRYSHLTVGHKSALVNRVLGNIK